MRKILFIIIMIYVISAGFVVPAKGSYPSIPPPCNCTPGQCQWCVNGQCITCGGNPGVFCCCGQCYGTGQCLSCIGGQCLPCDGNPCQRCENGVCVEICKSTDCEVCVDGGCLVCNGDESKKCCKGTCYDWTTHDCCGGKVIDKATHHCCGEDENEWKCENSKECCNGECCDTANCKACDWLTGEECISICDLYPYQCMECDGQGHCKSKCDPNNCETCVDGQCQSNCNYANCEECDGQGHCLVCGGDITKCCVNGECKPKCIPEGGSLCQYTLPDNVLCLFRNVDDFSCIPCWGPGCEDMFCAWEISGSPKNNDICQPGCSCELHEEACVMAYQKTCQNDIDWLPFPHIVCTCQNPRGLVDMTPFGTRTVCGPGI